jgi:hypothetical protein
MWVSRFECRPRELTFLLVTAADGFGEEWM